MEKVRQLSDPAPTSRLGAGLLALALASGLSGDTRPMCLVQSEQPPRPTCMQILDGYGIHYGLDPKQFSQLLGQAGKEVQDASWKAIRDNVYEYTAQDVPAGASLVVSVDVAHWAKPWILAQRQADELTKIASEQFSLPTNEYPEAYCGQDGIGTIHVTAVLNTCVRTV